MCCADPQWVEVECSSEVKERTGFIQRYICRSCGAEYYFGVDVGEGTSRSVQQTVIPVGQSRESRENERLRAGDN